MLTCDLVNVKCRFCENIVSMLTSVFCWRRNSRFMAWAITQPLPLQAWRNQLLHSASSWDDVNNCLLLDCITTCRFDDSLVSAQPDLSVIFCQLLLALLFSQGYFVNWIGYHLLQIELIFFRVYASCFGSISEVLWLSTSIIISVSVLAVELS